MVAMKVQKFCAVSGFSVQCWGEFAICCNVDLHVYEGYLLGGILKGEFCSEMELVHKIL